MSTAGEEPMPVEVFAVTPLTNCPHIEQVVEVPAEGLDVNKKCNQCEQVGENWVCLTCFEVNCSRYVHGHAVNHADAAAHPVAMSYADLSVWCYPCGAYLDNAVFGPFIAAAMAAKFGNGNEQVEHLINEL